jgi:hypothetical protein
MSDRDALAGISDVNDPAYPLALILYRHGPGFGEHAKTIAWEQARAILAAGWRPPANPTNKDDCPGHDWLDVAGGEEPSPDVSYWQCSRCYMGAMTALGSWPPARTNRPCVDRTVNA